MIASGTCKDQSDAYRQAFQCPKANSQTVRRKAFELMRKDYIQATIKKLCEPLDQKVRKTRKDLLDLFQGGAWFDPRKMFDSHGNPMELYDL